MILINIFYFCCASCYNYCRFLCFVLISSPQYLWSLGALSSCTQRIVTGFCSWCRLFLRIMLVKLLKNVDLNVTWDGNYDSDVHNPVSKHAPTFFTQTLLVIFLFTLRLPITAMVRRGLFAYSVNIEFKIETNSDQNVSKVSTYIIPK